MGIRRFPSSKQLMTLDLFPFLSVLACTIGCLILLVVAITTGALGNKRSVTIVAKSESGGNHEKVPRYIDCRGDGAVIYPTNESIAQQNIASEASALSTLLQQVSENREREYIIVAIRPDGMDCFKAVREQIEQRGIDIGYEPIDSGWKLKLRQ